MLRIGLACGMAVALLSFPLAAWAQDEGTDEDGPSLRPTLQSSGLDDDDDLLDPDLDLEATDDTPAAASTTKVVEPPLGVKTRIDDESGEIARLVDAASDEMTELGALLARDRDRANAEIERRTRETNDNVAALVGKVRKLEDLAEKSEKRSRSQTRQQGTYGTLIVFKTIPRTGNGRFRGSATDRPGEQQFQWWQRLTLKATGGLHRRLKGLNVAKINELKARADAIALSVDPQYRPYANSKIDEVVGTSRFAKPVRYDKRLDDLILPGSGAKEAPVTSNKKTKKKKKERRSPIPANFDRGDAPLVLLPRVRGPDGRVRVIVDRPLGGPFTAPTIPAGSDE